MKLRRLRTPRNPADRLLPEGRLGGPMPWVVAIMMFLTVLAAGAGLGLGNLAVALGRLVEGRLTVQISAPDAAAQEATALAIVERLRGAPGIASVRPVPRARLLDQLRPWLGGDLEQSGLPVPALVDVDLAAGAGDAARKRIEALVADLSPDARVEPHAAYVAPVAAFVRMVAWGAGGIVALMASATAATVVLAARGALALHRPTIEILHLMGATDRQVIRLFQRRLTIDIAFGALLGLGTGVGAALLVGRALSRIGGELLGPVALPVWGWAMLPLLAVLFVLLARVSARVTLKAALARAL